MTYQLERDAIETYLATQWAGATPLGLDGHDFTPVANSIQLDILPGVVVQGSIGQSGANRIHHTGIVAVRIYTAGGSGTAAWRGYAQTLEGLFFQVRLDNTGAVETGVDEFIRFSPQDQHPYTVGTTQDAPLQVTTLYAPFVRYSQQ